MAPLPRPEKVIGKECASSLTNSRPMHRKFYFKGRLFPLSCAAGKDGMKNLQLGARVGEKAVAKISLFSRRPQFKLALKPPAATVSLLILNSVKRNLFLFLYYILGALAPRAVCFFHSAFLVGAAPPAAFLSLIFLSEPPPRRPLLNFHSKSQFKFLFTWPSRRTRSNGRKSTAAPKKELFTLKWLS